MFSVEDQKDSSRDIVADIRVAALAMSRAAEGLKKWRTVEDQPEVQEIRGAMGGLVRDLARVSALLDSENYEETRLESGALKQMCDGVADLRPIGRLKAKLRADGMRQRSREAHG
jgi:hypothetical protein